MIDFDSNDWQLRKKLFDLSVARHRSDWLRGYHVRHEDALDAITGELASLIEKVAREGGVPRAMIQAVLYREMLEREITNDPDFDQIDKAMHRFLRVGMPSFPRQPLTDVGQIKIAMAIDAINHVERTRIDLDPQNPKHVALVKNKLQDPVCRVKTIALVLRHEAGKLRVEEGLPISEDNLQMLDKVQRKRLFSAYNGFREGVDEFGRTVYDFHRVFFEYNVNQRQCPDAGKPGQTRLFDQGPR